MRVGAQAAGDGQDPHRQPSCRDERELGDELHVVAEVVAAALVRRVPADAVLGAVDRRTRAGGRGARGRTDRRDGAGAIVPVSVIGCVTPLIVSSPLPPRRCRRPRDELGRLEGDLRDSAPRRRSRASAGARSAARPSRRRTRPSPSPRASRPSSVAVKSVKLPRKRVDARVGDLERDVGVDRIGRPGAGRCEGLGALDD